MEATEYAGWTEYAARYGFPHRNAEELLAFLCALLQNVHSRMGARVLTSRDFLKGKD